MVWSGDQISQVLSEMREDLTAVRDLVAAVDEHAASAREQVFYTSAELTAQSRQLRIASELAPIRARADALVGRLGEFEAAAVDVQHSRERLAGLGDRLAATSDELLELRPELMSVGSHAASMNGAGNRFDDAFLERLRAAPNTTLEICAGVMTVMDSVGLDLPAHEAPSRSSAIDEERHSPPPQESAAPVEHSWPSGAAAASSDNPIERFARAADDVRTTMTAEATTLDEAMATTDEILRNSSVFPRQIRLWGQRKHVLDLYAQAKTILFRDGHRARRVTAEASVAAREVRAAGAATDLATAVEHLAGAMRWAETMAGQLKSYQEDTKLALTTMDEARRQEKGASVCGEPGSRLAAARDLAIENLRSLCGNAEILSESTEAVLAAAREAIEDTMAAAR